MNRQGYHHNNGRVAHVPVTQILHKNDVSKLMRGVDTALERLKSREPERLAKVKFTPNPEYKG